MSPQKNHESLSLRDLVKQIRQLKPTDTDYLQQVKEIKRALVIMVFKNSVRQHSSKMNAELMIEQCLM